MIRSWLRLVLPAAVVALGVTWWINRESAPAASAAAHSGSVGTAPLAPFASAPGGVGGLARAASGVAASASATASMPAADTTVAASEPPPAIAATAPLPRPAASVAGPGEAAQAVRIALHEWAAAWSQRDMESYAAAYVPEFKGSQPSRQAWLEARTARIVDRKGLEVTLSDIDVTLDGPIARVSLVQRYRTETQDLRSVRRLQLRLVGDRWLIEREDGR